MITKLPEDHQVEGFEYLGALWEVGLDFDNSENRCFSRFDL